MADFVTALLKIVMALSELRNETIMWLIQDINN
jgi:hypothetical protein